MAFQINRVMEYPDDQDFISVIAIEYPVLAMAPAAQSQRRVLIDLPGFRMSTKQIKCGKNAIIIGISGGQAV